MRPGFYQTENKRSVAVKFFPFNFDNMRRQVQLNPDIKRAVFIRGFQEGYPWPTELFKGLQKEIERQNAEIREREEREWRTNLEKGNNGILKNWEMVLEKNRNGEWVTDIMERRQWGLTGPFEGC